MKYYYRKRNATINTMCSNQPKKLNGVYQARILTRHRHHTFDIRIENAHTSGVTGISPFTLPKFFTLSFLYQNSDLKYLPVPAD